LDTVTVAVEQVLVELTAHLLNAVREGAISERITPARGVSPQFCPRGLVRRKVTA
jgi:hypothetical protein